jgi:glycine cleavage system aminomethyltransferase T
MAAVVTSGSSHIEFSETPLALGRHGISHLHLAEDRFLIITGTAFGQHDISWLRLNMPDDGSVSVEDVGSSYACIGLWGPKSRGILHKVTSADLSNETTNRATLKNDLLTGGIAANGTS